MTDTLGQRAVLLPARGVEAVLAEPYHPVDLREALAESAAA